MTSIVKTFIVFFVVIGAILLIGATTTQETQNIMWRMKNITGGIGFPAIGGCSMIVLFFLWLTASAFADLNTHFDADRAFRTVINEEQPEQFSNEEILMQGIDVRMKSHRNYIKDKRNRTLEQEHEAKVNYHERPDSRAPGGRGWEHYTTGEYMGMLRKMFSKAKVELRPSVIGGKDMYFHMKDGRPPLTISPSRKVGGVYRVSILKWNRDQTHRVIHDIHVGDAHGAHEHLKRWYRGDYNNE